MHPLQISFAHCHLVVTHTAVIYVKIIYLFEQIFGSGRKMFGTWAVS